MMVVRAARSPFTTKTRSWCFALASGARSRSTRRWCAIAAARIGNAGERSVAQTRAWRIRRLRQEIAEREQLGAIRSSPVAPML
jgi:hypothetical protein